MSQQKNQSSTSAEVADQEQPERNPIDPNDNRPNDNRPNDNRPNDNRPNDNGTGEGPTAEGGTADAVVDVAAQEDGAEGTAEPTEGAEEETLEEAIARLESELAEAKAQANVAVDRMQRTVAEYENASRRRERQNLERIARATEGIALKLLPILDDFDLAFQNVPDTLSPEEQSWIQGFEQIQQKLLNVLADAGIEPLPPEGEFDPNLHEAISNEPNEDVPSGHIIQTLRSGYQHQDRILRPALVRVAQ